MALSPVDSRVAAASILYSRGGLADLWLITSLVHRLTADDDSRICRYPVWSADSKRLAYVYQPPGLLDYVYLKEIVSGVIAPPDRDTQAIDHPVAWSLDDLSLLVFTSDYNGRTSRPGLSLSAHSPVSLSPSGLRLGFFSPRDYFSPSPRRTGRPSSTLPRFPSVVRPRRSHRVPSSLRRCRDILVATLSHIAAYPCHRRSSPTQPTTLVRISTRRYTIATPDHSPYSFASPTPQQGEIRFSLSYWKLVTGNSFTTTSCKPASVCRARWWFPPSACCPRRSRPGWTPSPGRPSPAW